jgi:glyoxylase-like metal-dependent hydrolase (beta-lactamase superfamily II)
MTQKGTGMTGKPDVEGFYDARTGSVQYVVSDPETRFCAIIDPVLDYDEKSGSTATTCADALLAYVAEHGLTVQYIFDTHPHADHFTASAYLQQKTGALSVTGSEIVKVQALWRDLYNMPALAVDGSQWDRLAKDGDHLPIGNLDCRVIHSPGHTMASVSYVIGNAAFIHDTLFMPDSGTARADFPGGSAEALWSSIQTILALPDDTRLFTGHDYRPNGRQVAWESTVAEQKAGNIHLVADDGAAFAAMRRKRDSTLPVPKLMLHALQVNLNAGKLPEAENNGRRYLKIPLNSLPDVCWD